MSYVPVVLALRVLGFSPSVALECRLHYRSLPLSSFSPFPISSSRWSRRGVCPVAGSIDVREKRLSTVAAEWIKYRLGRMAELVMAPG